jgi:hypothetical protein
VRYLLAAFTALAISVTACDNPNSLQPTNCYAEQPTDCSPEHFIVYFRVELLATDIESFATYYGLYVIEKRDRPNSYTFGIDRDVVRKATASDIVCEISMGNDYQVADVRLICIAYAL